MHAFLHKTIGDEASISYFELVKYVGQNNNVVCLVNNFIRGKKAHTVAGTFFELLVLKTKDHIDLKQEAPYADILISKTVSHYYLQECT